MEIWNEGVGSPCSGNRSDLPKGACDVCTLWVPPRHKGRQEPSPDPSKSLCQAPRCRDCKSRVPATTLVPPWEGAHSRSRPLVCQACARPSQTSACWIFTRTLKHSSPFDGQGHQAQRGSVRLSIPGRAHEVLRVGL